MKNILIVAALLLLWGQPALGEKLEYVPAKDGVAVGELEDVIVMEPQEDPAVKYEKEDPAEVRKKAEPKSATKDIQLIDLKSSSENNEKTYGVDDCVDIAIKNHIQLEIANKNIKLGEMRLWEARRNMLPSLSMKTEETYGEVYGRRYRGIKSVLEGQFTIFKGGELYFTLKQSEINLKIVKEEYRRIKNDLVAQVKKQFYGVAKSKENLKIQSELKKETDAMASMVKKGHEQGAISKMEFLNVSSQASQVDFQLVSANGDLSVAELILRQTMNVEPNERFDIKVDLNFKEVNADYKDLLDAAFANRPEIKIANMMKEYYGYELKIAKAKGWPKVDLMGSWGLAKENYIAEDNGPTGVGPNGRDIADMVDKLEQQWYGGLKTSVPFWGSTGEYSFTREQWPSVVSAYQGTEARTNTAKINVLDNLKYYSERKSAEIDYDKSRQEFLKAKHDVTLEVKESCFSYEKAVVQLRTAREKLKYKEKEVELLRFKRGLEEAPDSDVIEKMIELSQEKFGHVQALTDCLTTVAVLNKAVGVDDYFTTGKIPDKNRGK